MIIETKQIGHHQEILAELKLEARSWQIFCSDVSPRSGITSRNTHACCSHRDFSDKPHFRVERLERIPEMYMIH